MAQASWLSRRVLTCAVLAGALALAAMVPTLRTHGWSLSSLVRVDADTPLGAAARSIEPGFRTLHPGAYDGQFYWAIAIDPFATGALHAKIDKPSYRYGHPLYGWLAWLVSLDRARAVPFALALIGVLALVFGAGLAALISRGRFPWAGLAAALNPGLLSSAAHDLAEPLAAALLVAALAAHAAGRLRLAWLSLALLPLAKEELLVAVAAVALWELLGVNKTRAFWAASAALPALGWWSYARLRFGAWFTTGDSALGRPLHGWLRLLRAGARGETPLRQDLAGLALALLCLLVLLALLQVRRLRSPVGLTFVGLVAIALCLAPNATVAFSTALRNTAFLVLLAPLLLTESTLLHPLVRPPRGASRSPWLRLRDRLVE